MKTHRILTGVLAVLATFFLTTSQARSASASIQLIDLGLSVKWADMNIDAAKTSDNGGFYAWGETATKATYTWKNYAYCSGTETTCQNIGSDISGIPDYDRACSYSPKMCLPTAGQWEELISQCTWKETTTNGVKGFNVTGPNGNTIFLPFSGCSYEGSAHDVGSSAYYWSANNLPDDNSKAKAAYLKSGTSAKVSTIRRRTGAAIRAVAAPVTIELVDLGLSVKWASMNIDAADATGNGGYYAWGETRTKGAYTWATYAWCSGTEASCQDIGSNISGILKYDRAKNYSAKMCLPTAEQWQELISKCTWKAATIDGVKGYNVTGPSGNSIFLPFSGCSYEGSAHDVGSSAYYWTANNESGDASKAKAAYVKSGSSTKVSTIRRRTGAAIRAVAASAPSGDQKALYNYRNDGKFNAWLNYEIDSITYSRIDTLGVEHDDIVVQEVWTPDSLYRIPLEAIDSIGFRAPAPKMRDNLFYIRDYHIGHTLSLDSLTVNFSKSINNDSLPSVGQVMLCVIDKTPFEEGFAGKVQQIKRHDNHIEVICSEVSPFDVFERLVIVEMGVSNLEAGDGPSKIRGEFFDEGIKTIELPEKWKDEWAVKFLDLFSITSKNPVVRAKLYADISAFYYYQNFDIWIDHPDLTYKVEFDWDKISKLGDEYKELKDVWKLLKEADYDAIVKSEQEKDLEEKEWEYKIPIPFELAPVNCVIEFGVMLKPQAANLKAGLEWKTSVSHHLGFNLQARNPLAPEVEGLTDGWHIGCSHNFNQRPCDSFKANVSIDGSFSFGVFARLKASLITKYLLHASVGAEAGIKLSYSGDFTLYDTDCDVPNAYGLLKDTNIGAKLYGKAKGEVGALPFDLINLSGEAEYPFWEGKFYLFPHFSNPWLATELGYNRDYNEMFTTTVSKQLIPLLSCKPGLAFYSDGLGYSKWNTREAAYFDDLPYDFVTPERDVQISANEAGLKPGETYRCYPVFKMFGKEWKAGPYTEFTYPQTLSLEIPSLILQKDDVQLVHINGGWGDYEVSSYPEDVVKAEQFISGNYSQVRITALKDGTASVKVHDKRSLEDVFVAVKVFGDPEEGTAITVSKENIEFGPLPYGTNATETFMITNHGSKELQFNVYNEPENIKNGFIVEGANELQYLQPGASMSFKVTAKGIGPNLNRSGKLLIASNATKDPVPLGLKVEGKATSVKYVDLGLSVKWAECNLGALAAADGTEEFYAWGETDSKPSYGWDTYTLCDGTAESCHNLGNISETDHDAANYQWGGKWRMPTTDEFKELLEKCTWKWDNSLEMVGGLPGYKITGPNGKSIFLEAAGISKGDEIKETKGQGFYLSSNQGENNLQTAQALNFEKGNYAMTEILRCMGVSIRPVYDENMQGLQLSTTTLTLTSGSQGTVNVTSGSGSYDAVSNAKNVATVTVEGSKIIIKAVAPGSATITVKDNQTQERAKIEVTVSDGQSTIKVTPLQIDYGDVEAGSFDLYRYVTISNNSEQEKTITLKLDNNNNWSLAFVGSDGVGGSGRDEDIFTKKMQPGEQVLARLSFKPSNVGEYNCNLIVTSEELEGWMCTVPVKAKYVEDPSFHLSTNSLDVYVNDYSVVYIHNGSGEYDIINDYSDIVEADINVPHIAHIPPKRYMLRDISGGRDDDATDRWYITGKKVGDAVLKVKDKKTNEVLTLNVKVKKAPSLSLSAQSVELGVGETDSSIEIKVGSGWYDITSDNTEIVTATRVYNDVSWVDGNGVAHRGIFVKIEGLKVGNAKVTVKDNSSGETAVIQVRVKGDDTVSYLTCPDDHHPHLIDLGLPSGTKWACCNVDDDASKQSPTNYGGYYAWGETKEHDDLIYNWSTYTHCDGSLSTCHDLGSDIAGTRYDVAHVKWGGSWVMPTKEQQDELRDNCTYEWTTVNGVNGGRFTSKINGGSIFLPAAGRRNDSGLYNAGSSGDFWSSTQYPSGTSSAYSLSFGSGSTYWYDDYRYRGQSVRPVVRN